jgi:hypothetical protein
MAEVSDVLNLDVRRVLSINPIAVQNMAGEIDVLNLGAKKLLPPNPINVLNMVEGFDVLNLDVRRVLHRVLQNVNHTAEVSGVLIVLTGLIQEAEGQNTMVIVVHVLNGSFQKTHVQR